jgi:predicted nuclease of restriction endonuclease-like (RecB) superfamily
VPAERKTKIQKKSEVSLNEYAETLTDLKKQIQEARLKAISSANNEMIRLYWNIGKTIAQRQERSRWGTSVIEKLAKDLQNAFPGIKGFSRANLFHMRAFYLAYGKSLDPTRQIDSLPFFNLPWWHNIILLTKLKDDTQRLWYAKQALECGWSQNFLEDWIKSDLYSRQGKAITNFQVTLPKPHSDLAEQSLKDPYCLDFLTLADGYREKELEQALTDNIQKLLLELGKGFAFVGRQVNLRMSDADYYVDLLFYNYKLHCFFVVELKNTSFKPEYAGKMAFYLAAVDHCLKTESDNRTIGMILCRSKDKLTVEYALKYNVSPIGISTYETQLIEKLPKELVSSLPTIEEIEAELEEKTKDE